MAEQKGGFVQFAFILLGASLAAGVLMWFATAFFGLFSFFPWGLIGLVPLVGMAILIMIVVRDRLNNPEDDHYSKNVDE